MTIDIELTLEEKYAVARKSDYAKEGRYRHASEFVNPFFVIMHEFNADEYYQHYIHGRNYPNLFQRQRDEIADIKRTYDFLSHNLFPPTKILPATPKNRAILVCGCFDMDCVEGQRDSLMRNGFEAYISFEGTFPIIDIDIGEAD